MPRVYIRDQKVIDEIIRKAQICHLTLSDNNRPYVIPMHFGYANNTLYLHSGKEGMKIDILKRNPNVAFSMECDVELIRGETACGFSANFRSVVGFGLASVIEDCEEKKRGLSILMHQYSEKSFTFPDKKLEIVAIIKVVIDEITARVHGYETNENLK